MTAAVEAPTETTSLITLRVSPALQMTEEQFYLFCAQNDELRIERTAEGDLEIMPPTVEWTGGQNAKLTYQVTGWALRDGTGEPYDSSTGFTLPKGAIRSPDASWISHERLAPFTPEQRRRGFLPVCPEFVVELRSPSDRLAAVQTKMREYIKGGALLGFLLDAPRQQVHVYRPGAAVELLDDPPEVSGEPELPGFTLDLRIVWGSDP